MEELGTYSTRPLRDTDRIEKAPSVGPRQNADHELIQTTDMIINQQNRLRDELASAESEVTYWTEKRSNLRLALEALTAAQNTVQSVIGQVAADTKRGY